MKVQSSPVKKELKEETTEDFTNDQYEPEPTELDQYDQDDQVDMVYEFVSGDVTVEETEMDIVEDEWQNFGEKLKKTKSKKEPKKPRIKNERVIKLKMEKPKKELLYARIQAEENGNLIFALK